MDFNLLLAAETTGRLSTELRIPLSVMMFLEFAIWGAWFVVLGNYLNALGFSRKEIARVYATMPIGAIISPMVVGTIADKYFNSEFVMAASHLIGAALLFMLSKIRTPRTFFLVALAYAIVYSPTLSLVNSIFFQNVPAELHDQFPTVRVLGTIGWIVAGMSLKLFIRPGEPVNNRPILLAAAFSAMLGVYSFFLPATRPGAEVAREAYDTKMTALNEQRRDNRIDEAKFKEEKEIADKQLKTSLEIPFLQALSMFRDPQNTIFLLGSLAIAMAMAIYFAFAALYLEQGAKVKPEDVGPVMTVGQWVEIFFLFTLSWFIDNWGMKTVLIVGIAAWALRFGIFSLPPIFPLILVAVGLHGICFDFFFAAGFMHTTAIAPPGITASAQSLYGVMVYGLGMWLGSELAGWLNHKFTVQTVDSKGQALRVTDWRKFWLIPCIGAAVLLGVFMIFFNPTKQPASEGATEAKVETSEKA